MSDGDWAAYRQEVFGEPYLVWHDGPDFDEIARRFADDPEAVLALLEQGIAENDPVAAQACRELGAAAEQVPTIVALLEQARPATYGAARTEVAASLHALGASAEEMGAEVAAVLRSPDHWGVRLDAARRLADFAPTPALVAAAADGVRAEAYLVRYHSANTLLRWAGRRVDISEDDELFGLIVDDGGPGRWAEAAERLAAAVPPPV
ncbi:hypothetical protein [Nocardioides halotolerans]|uniref:hypothetical protein n=1 Tax=Nocardioides halotolerans TaxID=433660 RepID=UPI00040D4589|nr:hypothetical protein [Nocardioides halotolerans]